MKGRVLAFCLLSFFHIDISFSESLFCVIALCFSLRLATEMVTNSKSNPQRSRAAACFLGATLILAISVGYWWTHREFTGVVVGAHYADRSRGHPTFLNLGHPYPSQEMTVVIWGRDRPAFPHPPEVYYLHRTIHVRGRIRHYRGKPEIVISSPDQIQVE
jgi:hypothetical protein